MDDRLIVTVQVARRKVEEPFGAEVPAQLFFLIFRALQYLFESPGGGRGKRSVR